MIRRTVIRTVGVDRFISRKVGPRGRSAYESYAATTDDDPVLTEEEWSAPGGGEASDPWGDAGITDPEIDADGVLTLTKDGVTYSFTGTRP